MLTYVLVFMYVYVSVCMYVNVKYTYVQKNTGDPLNYLPEQRTLSKRHLWGEAKKFIRRQLSKLYVQAITINREDYNWMLIDFYPGI